MNRIQCKFKHFKKRQSLKKRLETSSSKLLITWVTSNLNDWGFCYSLLVTLCASRAAKPANAEFENSRLDEEALSEETIVEDENSQSQWNVEVGNPIVPANVVILSLSDQAFLLLAFIACMTSVAFTSLDIAAVPTLYMV
nr:hypothetical protein CFP56_58551 [Quercus suber]